MADRQNDANDSMQTSQCCLPLAWGTDIRGHEVIVQEQRRSSRPPKEIRTALANSYSAFQRRLNSQLIPLFSCRPEIVPLARVFDRERSLLSIRATVGAARVGP